MEELNSDHNFDLCGYPHEEEEILPPDELIRDYRQRRAALDAEIDRKLAQIDHDARFAPHHPRAFRLG